MPYSTVDVRDVAMAHVLAFEKPEADGKRFILDGNEPTMAVNDIIAKCRAMFPETLFDDAPGPKGWDADLFMGKQPTRSSTDNSLSKTVLGLEYIDMETTIRDSVNAIVDNGFVPARPAGGAKL